MVEGVKWAVYREIIFEAIRLANLFGVFSYPQLCLITNIMDDFWAAWYSFSSRQDQRLTYYITILTQEFWLIKVASELQIILVCLTI